MPFASGAYQVYKCSILVGLWYCSLFNLHWLYECVRVVMEFFDGVCNFAPFKGCQQISPGEGEKVTGGDKRGGGKGNFNTTV